MGKLIYYELRKLLHWKITWCVIVGLLLANGMLVHYQINRTNEEGFCIKDIASVYGELEGENSEEQLLWLNAELERHYQRIFDGEEYSYGMHNAARLVYKQIEAISDYDGYLAGIDEQAELMMNSSLFGKPNTFSYRNITLTPQAYEHLKGTEVTADVSDGVFLVTENRLTDFFIILTLVILAMHLLISEREEGTLFLVKSTKFGRTDVMAAKAVTLLVFSVLSVLVFYGINLAAASNEVGLGDSGRPIQSLYGYLSSPYKLTVKQYIILFFAAKSIGVFAVLCVFFLVCIIFRNNTFSCLAAMLLFGLQALLWTEIDVHSYLSPLRQLNLVALLDTGAYFSNYTNSNMFGYPVNIAATGAVTAAAAIIIGIGAGIYVYVKETSSDVRRSRIREKFRGITERLGKSHCNLLRHEAYKLLIMNRGFFILLVFIVIQLFYFNTIDYFIDYEEYYYQNYSAQLEGELTEEKGEFLQNEQGRFDTAEQKRQNLMEMYQSGEIDERYFSYAVSQLEIDGYEKRAFEKSRNQYNQLEALREKNIPAIYIYQTGWSRILGKEAKRLDLFDYGKIFLVLILALSASEATEKTTHVNELIHVSLKGRRAVTKRKLLICVFFAFVTAAVSFLPRIISVFQTYGLRGMEAPARSILEMSCSLPGLDVSCFFALYQGARLITAGLAAILILAISRKTGNTIITMLISTAILLLPIAVKLLIR